MEKKTVLIADDRLSDLRVLTDMLYDSGLFEIISVNSSKEARTIAREKKLDLIILDIIMPPFDSKDTGLDEGFKIAEELKASPATKDIPIIFTSVRYDFERTKIADRLGIAFFVKPVDEFDFIEGIKEVFNINR